MPQTKRAVDRATPKGRDDWHTPSADLAALLFGRANLLKNSLNAATTRDASLKAAKMYLAQLRLLCEHPGMTRETGERAVAWLRDCTSAPFLMEALFALNIDIARAALGDA